VSFEETKQPNFRFCIRRTGTASIGRDTNPQWAIAVSENISKVERKEEAHKGEHREPNQPGVIFPHIAVVLTPKLILRQSAALRVSDRPFVGRIPMSENRSSVTLVVNREGEFADAEKLRGRGRVQVEVELRYRSGSSGRRADPFGPVLCVQCCACH